MTSVDNSTTPNAAGPDPVLDKKRLEAIARLDLESIQGDSVLEEIVSEATERLDLPVSLISLVLDQAQIFPAQKGLTGWMANTMGTPIEWSFCANAIRDEAPFVVEDAVHHPRVKNIPLVEHDNVRCYAGIPLRAPDGSILGTLCVIGSEERTFSEADLTVLRALASRAASRLAELAT
jgi:GAF domain-containing protein